MAALGGKSLFLLSEEGGRYRRLLSAWPSGGLASRYQDAADSSVRGVAPQLQVLHLSTQRPSGGHILEHPGWISCGWWGLSGCIFCSCPASGGV